MSDGPSTRGAAETGGGASSVLDLLRFELHASPRAMTALYRTLLGKLGHE